MTTVFITAIGGDVAQGVARVIRECRPDWRIVGADMGNHHGGSHFVDRLLVAPSANDPGYSEWLGAHLEREGVTYCIPINEAEIEKVVALPSPLRVGTHMVSAGSKAVSVAADKVKTARFLASLGIPAPWVAERAEDVPPDAFPCICKPRAGAGSRAVFICTDAEDARFLQARHPGSMFQELLLPDDAEVTVAVFRDRLGATAMLQLQRRLVSGATAWAEVIDDPSVTEQCLRIAEALDLRGAINVQLRRTADGPRVFEINARFSSTALMRHRLGFSDVIWALDDLSGSPVTTSHPRPGQRIARIQDAVILQTAIL
ncbi:ATP-grasp domain-containing protein [Roseicyclus marinus]|uniref:ATP-grasp domain-containing protein n=1 Tax=Roseicyclus marinus TaxID=2161673 RepID=UPI0030C7340F